MNGSILEILLLFSGGLVAGTLGGLLGIGGGVIIMPILRFVVGLSPAHAAGNCILAVFFTTAGGSYRHHRLGHIRIRSVVPVMVSGAIACAVFSLLFDRLSGHQHWLDLGIGLVFLLVSARMISEGIPGLVGREKGVAPGGEVRGDLAPKLIIGAGAGMLPGLLGIGTGGVLVPAFTFLLKTPVKTAMAASLVCFCLNALISSVFKYAQGYVDLGVILPMCAGTLIGANLGAVLNRFFSSGVVRLVFGLLFLGVALKFVISFFEVSP